MKILYLTGVCVGMWNFQQYGPTITTGFEGAIDGAAGKKFPVGNNLPHAASNLVPLEHMNNAVLPAAILPAQLVSASGRAGSTSRFRLVPLNSPGSIDRVVTTGQVPGTLKSQSKRPLEQSAQTLSNVAGGPSLKRVKVNDAPPSVSQLQAVRGVYNPFERSSEHGLNSIAGSSIKVEDTGLPSSSIARALDKTSPEVESPSQLEEEVADILVSLPMSKPSIKQEIQTSPNHANALNQNTLVDEQRKQGAEISSPAIREDINHQGREIDSRPNSLDPKKEAYYLTRAKYEKASEERQAVEKRIFGRPLSPEEYNQLLSYYKTEHMDIARASEIKLAILKRKEFFSKHAQGKPSLSDRVLLLDAMLRETVLTEKLRKEAAAAFPIRIRFRTSKVAQ